MFVAESLNYGPFLDTFTADEIDSVMATVQEDAAKLEVLISEFSLESSENLDKLIDQRTHVYAIWKYIVQQNALGAFPTSSTVH